MNPIEKDMQIKWVGLKAEISDNEYTTDHRNVNRKLTPYDNLILTPLNFKHNSSPLP